MGGDLTTAVAPPTACPLLLGTYMKNRQWRRRRPIVAEGAWKWPLGHPCCAVMRCLVSALPLPLHLQGTPQGRSGVMSFDGAGLAPRRRLAIEFLGPAAYSCFFGLLSCFSLCLWPLFVTTHRGLDPVTTAMTMLLAFPVFWWCWWNHHPSHRRRQLTSQDESSKQAR